jgi:hypothetical protein
MISDSELSELINVPKEWRSGDERIQWPRSHDKFNLDWLETLWKYLCEYSKNDLTMMENFNIIYSTTVTQSNHHHHHNHNNHNHHKKHKKDNDAAKNINLFKLSKNSNLVYTPSYSSNTNTNETIEIQTTDATNDTSKINNNNNNNNNKNSTITEEIYVSLIRILNKLGFQCIDSISPTILAHPLFQLNYVPNLRQNRFNLLRAFRNKYKHASTLKITQDFNALLNEADIKLLQFYLSRIEVYSQQHSADSSSSASASASKAQAQNQLTQVELEEERNLLDILKDLPIYENSAYDCSVRYIALKVSNKQTPFYRISSINTVNSHLVFHVGI